MTLKTSRQQSPIIDKVFFLTKGKLAHNEHFLLFLRCVLTTNLKYTWRFSPYEHTRNLQQITTSKSLRKQSLIIDTELKSEFANASAFHKGYHNGETEYSLIHSFCFAL